MSNKILILAFAFFFLTLAETTLGFSPKFGRALSPLLPIILDIFAKNAWFFKNVIVLYQDDSAFFFLDLLHHVYINLLRLSQQQKFIFTVLKPGSPRFRSDSIQSHGLPSARARGKRKRKQKEREIERESSVSSVMSLLIRTLILVNQGPPLSLNLALITSLLQIQPYWG